MAEDLPEYVQIEGTPLSSCSMCGVVVADQELHTEEHKKPTIVEQPAYDTERPRPPAPPRFPHLPESAEGPQA